MTSPDQPAQDQLGEFLRARRGRLRPADVGLPAGLGLRRTPGLRREELAAVAGLSMDYYIRLEQGKETNPSGPILDGLARALRLNEEEHTHLYALANHAAGRTARAVSRVSRVVRPGVRQLLETVRPCPAYVLTRTSDLLAADPEHAAETTAANLRALEASYPDDPDVPALIAELLDGSAEFARLWQRHEVRQRRGEAKPFRHPRIGEFAFTYEVLHLADGQRMTVYQAEPGTRDHDAMTLLSMIASGAEPELRVR